MIKCLKLFSKAVDTSSTDTNKVNASTKADVHHFAAEFVSRFALDKSPLPAKALRLTGVGNDYGFNVVFSRQLAGKATVNDVFLNITRDSLRMYLQCRIMCVAQHRFLRARWSSKKRCPTIPLLIQE